MRRAILLGIICSAVITLPLVARSQRHSRGPRPSNVGSVTRAPSSGAGAAAQKAKEADIRQFYEKMAASLALESDEKKEVFFYECRNVRGETMKRVMETFVSPSGMLATSDEADIIVVVDTPENLKMLRQIAESTDKPVPQVLVEARIVELTIDSDFEKEVNMAFQQLPEESEEFVKSISAVIGTPGANPNTTQGSLISLQPWAEVDGDNQRRLTMFLRYLQTRGQAKILSSPCLILRRGAEGSIITGEEVPILTQTVTSGAISTSTEFKSVGIKLRVIPIMVSGGQVRLELNPEVSTVTGFASAGEGVSNPTIAVRNALTDLTVKDGQLVSVGGLYRSEEREVKRQVPILGSIPILGILFRGTRKERVETQLVIFLTINILDPSQMTPDTVKPAVIPDAVRKEMDLMGRKTASRNDEGERQAE